MELIKIKSYKIKKTHLYTRKEEEGFWQKCI